MPLIVASVLAVVLTPFQLTLRGFVVEFGPLLLDVGRLQEHLQDTLTIFASAPACLVSVELIRVAVTHVTRFYLQYYPDNLYPFDHK